MNRPILCTVAVALLSCLGHGVVDAQPALRELENRINRLLAPPAEPPETPPAPRGAIAEPGYAGFFADNAGTGVRGALVTSINSGGPAEAAGLRTGDLITSANDKPISSIEDLSGILGVAKAGDTVQLDVQRSGTARKLTLRLTKRPASGVSPDVPPRPEPLLPEPRADGGPSAEHGTLGVRVVPVGEEARIRYGIPVRRGAVIAELTSGGPAQAAGLKAGSVIVSIDGRRIDSPDDLVGYIRTTVAGQKVEVDYYWRNELRRVQVQLGKPNASVLSRPTSPRAATPSPAPGPIFGEDRPALRKIESVIDRLVAPAPAGVPVAPSSETVELRSQLEALQRQVETMERRIAELERRLADSKKDE